LYSGLHTCYNDSANYLYKLIYINLKTYHNTNLLLLSSNEEKIVSNRNLVRYGELKIKRFAHTAHHTQKSMVLE